ncbi:DNA ligase [Thiomicrorhabdus xiamenensis]|uniref:DNA ligase n=1 Tax=Thiomicrorhabdus xiamenensis TaxID=2739063 RepID=A0A7D4SZD9_9GAMM|nr:DNA ligase [Thiomicrorhabdus xiamenensis]QKI89824.1 DNA ligase [Thiomicrorhabdus xiamenensis]
MKIYVSRINALKRTALSTVSPALLGFFVTFSGWVASGLASADIATRPELFLPTSLSLSEAGRLIEVSADGADEWFLSRKYDGVRAYWNGASLVTRQGNKISAPAWFTDALPPFALDGELWSATGQFSFISGLIRSSDDSRQWEEGWRAVTYRVFEVPNQEGGLMARMSILKHYLRAHPSEYLKPIAQHRINSSKQLTSYFRKIVGAGGEGIILRNGALDYQTGRLESVLKIKPYSDAECIVVGYKPGKGRLQGKVGSLSCALLNHQKPRLFPELPVSSRTIIYLGSGLSDRERAKPPEVGAMVTFKYSGLTRHGLPRFPVFIRQRFSAREVRSLSLESQLYEAK